MEDWVKRILSAICDKARSMSENVQRENADIMGQALSKEISLQDYRRDSGICGPGLLKISSEAWSSSETPPR